MCLGAAGEVWPAVHSFGCDGSIGECHSCDFLFSPIDVNDDAKAAIDDGTPVVRAPHALGFRATRWS